MSVQKFTSMFEEFKFGKCKGETLTDVITDHQSYIQWLYEKDIIEIDEKIEKQFNKETDYVN